MIKDSNETKFKLRNFDRVTFKIGGSKNNNKHQTKQKETK